MSDLFHTLQSIQQKPKPFEFYTAADLWTDAHVSAQMLTYHLNEELDLASRRPETIEKSVQWLVRIFQLNPQSRVIDFGCGPGLYAERLARSGANITGVDFSSHSINYARNRASELGFAIDYQVADYNHFESDETFDLIMMVMCDFGVLSPEQRHLMLRKFAGLLKPNGALVFDVCSLAAFEKREEAQVYGKNLMDGFWSSEEYFGFQNTYRYESEKVVLDKYVIVEEDRERTIYNWFQFFDPKSLQKEIESAGLRVDKVVGDLIGSAYSPDNDEFAVIVRGSN